MLGLEICHHPIEKKTSAETSLIKIHQMEARSVFYSVELEMKVCKDFIITNFQLVRAFSLLKESLREATTIKIDAASQSDSSDIFSVVGKKM